MNEASGHNPNETQAVEKPAFHLGGQALIEGVMMRSPHFIAASVRRADGGIETRIERFHSVLERSKLFRLPFVRGVIAMIEMMGVGSRFLRWSGDLVMMDENAKIADEKAKKANVGNADGLAPSSSESSPRSADFSPESAFSARETSSTNDASSRQ